MLTGNKLKPQVGCVTEHLKRSHICVFHRLVLNQVFKLQLVFIMMLLISLGLNTHICLCVHTHVLYVHICVSVCKHTHSRGMCANAYKRFCVYVVVCAAHTYTYMYVYEERGKERKRNFIFRQVANTKSTLHIPEIWVMSAELHRGEMLWGFLLIFKGNRGTQ